MAKRFVKKVLVDPKPTKPPKPPKIITTCYAVAYGNTVGNFEVCLNSFIQDGYQPWGSPHFAKNMGDHDPTEVFCYQAVIRKREVLDPSGHTPTSE